MYCFELCYDPTADAEATHGIAVWWITLDGIREAATADEGGRELVDTAWAESFRSALSGARIIADGHAEKRQNRWNDRDE